MKNFKRCFLPPTGKIIDALQRINESSAKVCLIVDAEEHLLGLVTDGDIRRGLLQGISLDQPVSSIMVKNPITLLCESSTAKIRGVLKRKQLFQIPLVDSEYRVVDLVHADEVNGVETKENLVLIMAGGYGKRLGELTRDLPKPMLQIGGKPMLERIIEGFREHGFSNFRLSVFFKSEIIKTHFGDGENFGVNIKYLEEDTPLGTAGPLAFLRQAKDPIIMINGDVLTKTNFSQLLENHIKNNADFTVCGAEHISQSQYGVLQLDGAQVLGVSEKPITKQFINTGIYVINPRVLHLISDNERIDMNHFIHRVLEAGYSVKMFPLHEYWIDVGLNDQLEAAQKQSKEHFK